MLTEVGLVCIGILLTVLTAVTVRFLYLSDRTTYNPCTYNVYKDDYRHFAMTGVGHSVAIGIITSVQLLSDHFPYYISRHFAGSLQLISLIPTMVYYHLLVINYKFRFLEVRHRGHSDYSPTIILELFSVLSYVAFLFYAVMLAVAEAEYPDGIYSLSKYSMSSGFRRKHYEFFAIGLIIVGTGLLLGDLFRIARNSYRTHKVEIEQNNFNHYWFRKYVSKNIEPHFVNDFLTLYLPTQYFILRIFPGMRTQISGFDLFAKCLLIFHPIMFIVIYMTHIYLATRMVDKNEMECRCCVCQKKDQDRKASKPDSLFIKLKVMRSRRDNGAVEENGEEERGGGGGAASTMENQEEEQPTETTPAMYTPPQIKVSEDL